MKHSQGFTLIEVMVTAVIFVIVTVYLTQMLTTQSRTYTVVDNISETQQNLRAIADLMAGEVRMTGFLVPEAAAVCGYDTGMGSADSDPDVLFVTDADSLDPAGVNTLQLGVTVTSGLPNFSSSSASVTLDSTANLTLDGNAFYDLSGNGTADSDFLFTTSPLRKGGVILVDRSNPGRGAACGIIEGISGSTLTVDFTVDGAQPGGSALGGAGVGDLVAIPAHAYWIGTAASGKPQLMRDGMAMAPDVEDLQVAFFYDADNDRIVDGATTTTPPFHSATEYPGSGATGSTWQSSAWDNSDLREIRVTLVARTRSEDPEAALDASKRSGQPQMFENRAAFSGSLDGFRRRSVTMAVQPRNVGLRPAGL